MRIGRRSGPSSRDCSAASGVSPVPVALGSPDRLSRAARVALAGLGAYRVALSPVIGGTCRFTPSCSAYAEEAVTVHGALRGGWLALKRLARCHPFGGWGYDPVPARDSAADG